MFRARTRIAGILAVAPLLGAGLAVLPGAGADAAALSWSCHLRIKYDHSVKFTKYYRVYVSGASPNYQRYVFTGVRLYADDDERDQLITYWNVHSTDGTGGLVRGSALNEDDSFFNKEDEIYATCQFYDQYVGSRYSVKSNQVTGHYG